MTGDRAIEPAVSVCIRTLGRRPGLLCEAIESVLAQTFHSFEIVVVDDSDRLFPLVGRFDDPRIRYYSNGPPRGSVAAIRRALRLARGHLVGLLDDDDIWLPDFLATVLECFERDPRLGFVFTDHYLDLRGRRVPRRPPLGAGRQEDFLTDLLEYWPVTLSSSLMRREVWDDGERRLPLADGTIGDISMWVRAAMAGWAFHYVDRPLAVWRQHTGQMTWDQTVPARNIATFERFRFEDPAAERLRRARLAEARLAQANLHIRQGRVRGAWREIGRARRAAAPDRLGVRGLIALGDLRRLFMRLAVAHPRLLTAGAPVWRRVRPRVAPRRDPPHHRASRPVRRRRQPLNALIRGDILQHQGTSGNNRALPDFDALGHDGPHPDEAPVTDRALAGDVRPGIDHHG